MVDFQQSSFKRVNFCIFLIDFLHIMHLLKDLLKKERANYFFSEGMKNNVVRVAPPKVY